MFEVHVINKMKMKNYTKDKILRKMLSWHRRLIYLIYFIPSFKTPSPSKLQR